MPPRIYQCKLTFSKKSKMTSIYYSILFLKNTVLSCIFFDFFEKTLTGQKFVFDQKSTKST